jgi:predicted NodU family carbamoyl transferase
VISLGSNYSQMHDSSACIARDGELLFAVAEERISRIKHDDGFPHHAIRASLEFASVRANELDAVCAGWPPPRIFCRMRRMYAEKGLARLRGWTGSPVPAVQLVNRREEHGSR